MPSLPRRQLISRRQENGVARDTGGHATAGSGSSSLAKGDVSTERMLGECKITEGKGFSLRMNHKNGWAPIERKAQAKGKEPWMQITVEGKELVVVDYQWFLAARLCFEKNGGHFPDRGQVEIVEEVTRNLTERF